MSASLTRLVDRARAATPSERIDLRDSIAAHGTAAVEAMSEWLADPALTRFAVRVIGKVGESGEREAAVQVLREARVEATPDQQLDIDAELLRLGIRQERAQPSTSRGVTSTAPGWMMRTDRRLAEWLWSEVEAGRLRQGWGYQPKQELNFLRHRREQGEAFDRDDDWAWANRRMLSDEPGGMQIGDLVITPHLPSEWRWSVLRIIGPYRYEIHQDRQDYGHILPVEIVIVDLGDRHLTPETRSMRSHPGRLRRLSQKAHDDVMALVGTGR